MPHSYHADDRVFQKLRAAGKSSWDEQADPHATFDTFIMRPFLEQSLATIASPLNSLSALEIGCGSGPICCYLASKGLSVRGIDVSLTALDMARQHAGDRGLKVRFDAADICNMVDEADRASEQYDLIIDGHCLHCIVLDDHRRNALAAIHHLLKPIGLLLIETMISHPALVVGANYRFSAAPQCVLATKVDDPDDHEGAYTSDGVWFAPYRRLLTEDLMAKELHDAGFVIHSQRAMAQSDGRKPMLMQIRAELRAN